MVSAPVVEVEVEELGYPVYIVDDFTKTVPDSVIEFHSRTKEVREQREGANTRSVSCSVLGCMVPWFLPKLFP